MTTTVEIDLNVRTAYGTFSGLEDCDGPVEVGDVVNVLEPESGAFGGALVTGIDEKTRIVYLSLAWNTLTIRPYSTTAAQLDDLRRRALLRVAGSEAEAETPEEVRAQAEGNAEIRASQFRTSTWRRP